MTAVKKGFWLACAVLVMGGCDRLLPFGSTLRSLDGSRRGDARGSDARGSDARSADATGDSDASERSDACGSELHDAFEGPSMGPIWEGSWQFRGTGTTLAQTGGRLTITPTSTIGYAGYESFQWNLEGGLVAVEVPRTTSVTSLAETCLELDDSTRLAVFCYTNGEILTRVSTVNHEQPTENRTEVALAPRWWRLRHQAPMLLWESSGDGQQWAPVWLLDNPLDLKATRVRLFAGTYSEESDPGVAEFDNFRAVVHCP